MHNWAAIFDWDGVILDSSREHEAAWKQLAVELGRAQPPGFFRRSFGMKNEKVIRELLGWTQDAGEIEELSRRKEGFFRQIIQGGRVVPLPGVVRWLERLEAAAIPCAVASSTPRENIECVIDALGLRDRFLAQVTAEDVTQGKPDPEVFLLAAQRLGFPPALCLVFEDAHVGIEAARAAGMKVVAVPTTHPASTLQDADLVVRQLDELNVNRVTRWFA